MASAAFGADSEVGLRIEVRGTGIGIAADDLTIVRPFSQADTSMSRGLAPDSGCLCVVRSRTMGGEISVNSTEGVGGTFWFHGSCPSRPS